MTRRTRQSLERHYRAIETTDSKGKVLATSIVKRREVLEPIKKEEWTCGCGMKYMVSIGQTIKCTHKGVTRKQKRALIHKYGKHNWFLHKNEVATGSE